MFLIFHTELNYIMKLHYGTVHYYEYLVRFFVMRVTFRSKYTAPSLHAVVANLFFKSLKN